MNLRASRTLGLILQKLQLGLDFGCPPHLQYADWGKFEQHSKYLVYVVAKVTF